MRCQLRVENAVARLVLLLQLGQVFLACFLAAFLPFLHGEELARGRVNVLCFRQYMVVGSEVLGRSFAEFAVLHVAYGLNFHGSHSHRNHAQLFGRSHGEVYHSAANKRATVGNAHHYLFAIFLIGYFEQGSEGERAVSAGQTVLVVARAVAGDASVETVAVKRCFALRLCQASVATCDSDQCC